MEFDSTRAVLIKDIERCPYVPGEAGYIIWTESDKARINKIVEEHRELFNSAKIHLNHEMESIKDMAKFIVEFFGKD